MYIISMIVGLSLDFKKYIYQKRTKLDRLFGSCYVGQSMEIVQVSHACEAWSAMHKGCGQSCMQGVVRHAYSVGSAMHKWHGQPCMRDVVSHACGRVLSHACGRVVSHACSVWLTMRASQSYSSVEQPRPIRMVDHAMSPPREQL